MSGQREHPTPGAPPPDHHLLPQDVGIMASADRILRELERQGLRATTNPASPATPAAAGEEDRSRNGRCFPASSEAIASCLRETTAAETKEDECAVCCEGFEEGGDRITAMPCSHGFHEGCILRWLRISRLCPLCRFALSD